MTIAVDLGCKTTKQQKKIMKVLLCHLPDGATTELLRDNTRCPEGGEEREIVV